MSQTADFQAVQPQLKQKEKQKIEKDIASLLVKRKNLGRFLQIDKEKEELLKLQGEAKKMKIQAQNTALDIVAKARLEADGIKAKSIKDKEASSSLIKKQTIETSKLLEDAQMRQSAARKTLALANNKLKLADEKLKVAEEGLKSFKAKVKRASRVLSDMADQ